MLQAPYEMQWRVDDNGVPYSVALEETVVVTEPYLFVTLEEIPDSYYRVGIQDTTEDVAPILVGEVMSKAQVKDGKYFVDYNNGTIHFGQKLVGRTLKISYYGRGFKRINAKRIVGLQTDGVMGISLDTGCEERIVKLEKLTVYMQKQIEFLINEIEKLSQE